MVWENVVGMLRFQWVCGLDRGYGVELMHLGGGIWLSLIVVYRLGERVRMGEF